jgi:hypothetical protein
MGLANALSRMDIHVYKPLNMIWLLKFSLDSAEGMFGGKVGDA